MDNNTLKQYSINEEIANSIIHGIGVILSIVGLTVLLVLAYLYGTTEHLVSYTIYGSSLILLYTSSTLYHALTNIKAKKILKICDHAAIYLLIAGCYTPFFVINIKGILGWSMMGAVWGLAIVGVIFKIFFTGRNKLISVLTYLGMSWMILIAAGPLVKALSSEGIIWFVACGFTYSIGTIFYMKKIPFFHAIWHLFVLLGSIFHYIAIIYSSNFIFSTF